MNNTLKGAALVYTLIKELSQQYPNVQIGKTVIQKMMYLLGRELKLDFGFSMYHYGPYSAQVANYLNFIERIEIIDVRWDLQKGYFIFLKENKEASDIIKELEDILDEKEKSTIKEMVRKYGSLDPIAIKLSIIATALFVRDEFGVKANEQLINIIKSLKPEHSDDYIKRTLKDASVIL
jgi:uncharacterized protein YwgA